MAQIEQAFLDHLNSDVDISVELGVSRHLGKLGDPSLENHQVSINSAKTLIEQIETKGKNEDFHQNLDLSLMKRHLQLEVFYKELQLDSFLQRQCKPCGVGGTSAGIFQLFINDERASDKRLDDILSRLKLAPDFLQKELQVITTPVERWLAIELEQASGLPELFDNLLAWAKEVSYQNIDALSVQIDCVKAALKQYIDEMSKKETRKQFAIGLEKVNELLALRQIDKSPEQLRQMAQDFMGETQGEIKQLKSRLLAKYDLNSQTSNAELHEWLNTKFSVQLTDGKLDSVLDFYHQEKAKILTFIKDKDLFVVPDDQDMVIMKTPGFLEPVIPAGAMWPPLALREGTKKSMVYLTLKEDELDEHTHLGIPVMMVHEGIPGHHLQFASASLHQSLIRRVYSANEHAEGWTTMLEDYILDQGYVEENLVDEVRFIAKREMSRLIARVGIDLYFMIGDPHYLNVGIDLEFNSEDPFENAAKLLKTATGFTDGRVQAELNWYSAEQGYPLSYLTGNRMVWQLKRDIIEVNKKQLSEVALDKLFHKIYLESGNMPVASLRAVFEHEGLL